MTEKFITALGLSLKSVSLWEQVSLKVTVPGSSQILSVICWASSIILTDYLLGQAVLPKE
jgi:hypothetical protein